MSLAAGSCLGPYEIVALLGAGGMGEVYRARDTRLGRDVAIKVLPAEFASDPERLRRFEQEARAVAALNHPNILAIYDVGTHEGAPVHRHGAARRARRLRDRLRGGGLPVRKAVEIAVQIATGLAAAHEKGIVHRDLKPENVFITKDGHVKILDFGIAKLVAPRSLRRRPRRRPRWSRRTERERPRHGGVHVAGAGAGAASGPADGHLLVRVRAVRDALGAVAVPEGHRRGHDDARSCTRTRRRWRALGRRSRRRCRRS